MYNKSVFPFRIRVRTKADTTDVHALSDAGTGEGISLQPLPDAPTKNRNCACARPVRATNKNMVPEPADEMEEGEQLVETYGSKRQRPTSGEHQRQCRGGELNRHYSG